MRDGGYNSDGETQPNLNTRKKLGLYRSASVLYFSSHLHSSGQSRHVRRVQRRRRSSRVVLCAAVLKAAVAVFKGAHTDFGALTAFDERSRPLAELLDQELPSPQRPQPT